MFLTTPQAADWAQSNDRIMMSIIWSVFFAAFSMGGDFQTGNIMVVAEIAEPNQGQVHIALFRDATSFPNNKEACQGIKLPADGASVQHTFQGLPFGSYAVAVFQDLNSNGKLDRNLFGIPSEPYDFSNNPVVKWQEPTFQEAAFVLNQSKMQIDIKLKNWENH